MKKENWMIGYMKEKGIYLAMALCIIGASAAAWATAGRSAHPAAENSGSSAEQVEQNVSGEEKTWTHKPDAQKETKPQPQSGDTSGSSAPHSSSSAAPQPSEATQSSAERSGAQPEPQPQPQLSWTWPVTGGEVIAGYSGGELVKNKTLNVWRTHDAVDISAGEGADVYAVADGTVAAVSEDALWGGMIQLEHAGGYTTVYYGVQAVSGVKAGETVKTGQRIGTVGKIPSEISEGSHLHLSISKDSEAIDPQTLLAPKEA